MFYLLRLFVFLLTMVGYFGMLRFKFKINISFIPITVTSLIGILVFFSGILNIMKIVVFLIVALGCFCFFKYTVFIRDSRFFKWVFLYFIMLVYFYLVFKDAYFNHYDNFSHWGVVAREILETNQFPSFKSSMIQFPTYITGSASFIYFICKVIGSNAEGTIIFANLSISLAALFSFMCFIERKNIGFIVPITVFSVVMLTTNIMPYDLLVDTQMPAVALAWSIIILDKKINFEKMLNISLLISAFLITIKSSAMFFVFINVVLIWLCYRNNVSLKLLLKKCFLILLSVFTVIKVWKAHTEYVFNDLNNAKHNINFNAYLDNFKSNGNEKNIEIISAFIKRIISLQNVFILIFVGMILMAFIVTYIYKSKIIKIHLNMFVVFTYVIYELMLLLMYLFSMPYTEAKGLDGFVRYDLTINSYVLGLILVSFLINLNDQNELNKAKDNISLFLITFWLCCIGVMTHASPLDLFLGQQSYNLHKAVEQNFKDNNLKVGKPGIVYIENKKISKGYAWYVSKYTFRTDDVTSAFTVEEFNELDKDNKQILIIYSE